MDGWGPMLKLKTLHIYFPNEVLPIMSRTHLHHFLRLMGRPEADERSYDVVRLNRALLATAQEVPELAGWSTKELERFFYFWADPKENRRVVKIAPGELAKYWDDCHKGEYICIGWDEVGDLRDFDDKDEFYEAFRKNFSDLYKNHATTLKRKSNEVWTLTELEPGDIVIANKGTSKILAVGEVVEPGYEFMSEREEYKHIVRVKWDTSYAKDIEPQKRWAVTTVAKVAASLYEQILTGKGSGKVPVAVDERFLQIADALERKGQAILYGPPGTGKTYSARRFAVWWLSRHQGKKEAVTILADSKAFDKAERELSTVQVNRRTWWVVANPKNWSWEQLFKDGTIEYDHGRLKRNYPKVQPGDLVIGYQASPDKRIVALAEVSQGLHANKKGEQKIELKPVAQVEDGPTYQEMGEDRILKDSEPMRFNNQGTLFALTEDEADHLLASIAEKNPAVREHVGGAGGVGPLTRLTFHASYSYEDFIEGFRPVDTGSGQLSLRLEDGLFKRICREAQANPERRYVVLVDEFNRANVAKVLGELITLLETDKRGLMITLPQSKEAFAIPSNVFLLGTMNTADRSIKLLDAALRRRFAFIELMPDASLLEGATVGNLALDDFLEELNKRVAKSEGREKQIGHSFLLEDGQAISEADEFARRFRQEILPLLQEYCYDDYGALAQYIGDKLVDSDGQTLNQDVLDEPEALLTALEVEFAPKPGAQSESA
jgi:5-methylcytosine-specific restriction protein B